MKRRLGRIAAAFLVVLLAKMRRKDEFTAIRRIIGSMALQRRRNGFALLLVVIATNSCWASTTYDAAAAFEQGWSTHSNPNGVWSYGYSSGFANPITLYDQTAQPGVNGPNAQYWLSSSVNLGESPSAEFNNGPAFNDGNVNFLENEFVLVAGIGGQYSDLVFTAPADGVYSIACSFRGAQNGIGTVVAVVANGNILFSSSVSAVGQTVPFDTEVTLTAGSTVVFSVGPGGGLQNTGLSVTITTPPATGANFVYTNNNINGPNTVSGFSVAANGTLTPVPGSPFTTGGTGNGIFFGYNSFAVTNIGNFLFASDAGSNDVSVFSINPGTGALSLVAGSPFATGGSAGSNEIGVSPTPDGMFLMAANSGSHNLTVFSIASSGALSPIAGSPFPALSLPDAIKVSPDRKFLAVAEPLSDQVEMFSIASNGSLTSLGAFPGGGGNFGLTGVDINCASSLLYGGEASTSLNIVDGYSITSTGALTPIPGSPFMPGVGVDSNVVLLSPDDKTLFVSNGFSGNTITAFSVASNGSLMLVPGSPFPMNPGAIFPLGMAISRDGSLLYVANGASDSISVFSVASNGALTEVAGSPFPGQSAALQSLTAFPPKSCKSLAPTLTSISPTSAVAGGAAITLTVNGTNFVSGSAVNFNGSALATTFVSATQLTATILASDIASAGSFNVTVTNPVGGTSNAVSFTVVTPQQATEAIINSVNALFSQGVLNGGQDNSLVVKLQHAINVMNAGKNDAAIRRLDSFINEVNDLLSSGVLSLFQAASLVSAAQSVIAALP